MQARDTSTVTSDGEKLSVAQFDRPNKCEIRVESHGQQLVIACSPRDGLDVIVAARPNVAHSEIAAALEDVGSEVQHTRALLPKQGFDEPEGSQ